MTLELSGADVGMLATACAVIVFAVAYGMLRADRRDPLERLASWAEGRELHYVAEEVDGVVAAFDGDPGGLHVRVTVTRVARGFGSDLPTRLTTITAFDAGAVSEGELRSGEVWCVVQPAGWVLDRDGNAVGEALSTGDPAFDDEWAVRAADAGVDAAAVAAVLRPAARSRLMESDAQGLIVEIAAGSVAIPMPGVCSDPRELDRRLAVATAIAKALA